MDPNSQNQAPQPQPDAQIPQPLPQQNQPPMQAAPTQKAKPPIAARILYILGFLGLIVGLFAVVMIIYAATQANDQTRVALALLGVGNLYAEAAFLAFIVVGAFTLIDRIKAGKKWALVSYTTLFVLATGATLLSLITASEIDRLLGTTSDDVRTLVLSMPVGILLVILWARNRDYFS